ncbi:MAG: DUF1549 and DUF1553 domain-containing protein [Pirellulales bacterium]|nr:DUF1549 and DUF1553 domain-containing protein [Pirellulales bacterium]
MAVLSKAGCNMGACHGNQNGKGGFKLSLRGQDAAFDFHAIAREFAGRRVNAFDPDASLLLQKPSMAVAHEGGMRLRPDSLEYDILRKWIAAGAQADSGDLPTVRGLHATPQDSILTAPQSSIPLNVQVEWSDGRVTDVTRLACYETSDPRVKITPTGVVEFVEPGEATILVRYLDVQQPVRVAQIPNRSDFVWQAPPGEGANLVDRHIEQRLKALRINPSLPCADHEFIRRATLDLLGILPTTAEVQAFLADSATDKREKLIDSLLQRPEFAESWATKWADILRVEEKYLDSKGVRATYEYLRGSLAANKPLDQLCRELVSTTGSTYDQPASNYYRALRDPISRAEATAQVFLGIRLQCAKCHNHPFDRWTQEDYYRWTAVFSRIDYDILKNLRRDDNDKHEFIGEQIVKETKSGEVTNPLTQQPAEPRFLGGADALPQNESRLATLGQWLTARDNRQFARALANRIWFYLLGQGLVEPVDDFRAANPATHPELLEALADELINSGYDLRRFITLVMRSQTYQRSYLTNASNSGDEGHYARTIPRRLPAEALLDAICQVTGSSIDWAGQPDGTRAAQRAGVGTRRKRAESGDVEKFLKSFGKPPRLTNCECERSSAGTIGQSLQLLSGPLLQELLADPDNRLSTWLQNGKSPEEIINELWWTALSRPPTQAELTQALAHWHRQEDPRRTLEDFAWALINSHEFWFRR